MKLRFLILQPLCIIFFICFIFIFSCKKNSNQQTPTTPTQPQSPVVAYVNASISGRVVDMNQKPLANVVVSSAFNSTTTDINGQFIFTNTQFDKNAAYVKASAAGYFNGSKTIQLVAGSSNYIQIALITKNQSGQFTASSGGSVTISNGGSINFSANSIVDSATSAVYTGLVTVSAYFLNPSMNNFGSIMPGQLTGIATDSSLKALQSFGMMVVELTGASGQKLQIASGKTASLTFPIQSNLLPSAQDSIPLWYFDEVKGLWRQQGSAALQGNNYVGTVSHFSFWNCDHPFPIVNFKALIEDKTNSPLPAIHVVIKNVGDSTLLYGDGYTNSTGNVYGLIPADKNLQLLVYNRCGGLIYTKNFTTTGADIDLGTINADAQSTSVIFSGTVVNCSGAPITNGTVSILLDGFFTDATLTNGTFSITVNRCYSTSAIAQITATDLSTNLIDTLSINNITSTNITSLQLTSCTLSNQYIKYTVNNMNYEFDFPPDSISAGFSQVQKSFFIIAAYQSNTDRFPSISFGFSDTTLLTNINASGIDWIPRYWNYNTSTVILTNFNPVGGYITGTFSSLVYDSLNNSGTQLTLHGSFNVKRTY